MNTTPVLYLMMGLLFGTTFLSVGIALGYWFSKRGQPDYPLSSSSHPLNSLAPAVPSLDETQQIVNAIRNFATWTTDLAGDFSRYQSTLSSLTRRAADGSSIQTKEDVQVLLEQIVAANRLLQERLDSAEQKLEDQTKQLAGYLSEARTDGLTGLANRRAFDQKIEECFSNWIKSQRLFSLALIDIDHFKKINDTYGHPAGDAVLREVALRLKDFSADTIQVARYGGEEFAILLECDAMAAAQVMEKIRLAMCDRTVPAEGHDIPVTLSCGVSQIVAEDRIGKLVRRSDEALYTAKMAGRNRVFIHHGQLCEVFGNPSPTGIVQANTGQDPGASSSSDALEEKILRQIDHILAKHSRSV
ncbi:Response regulator PleD [Pirellula sp. SH-Sr6A]|uniref:GGDEF domain-containing protein n=1 Tax=Pirellula sp. SH-Sr6A TaxID=1632865 RepID=UPI00078E0A9B|nr:GGDEF domain-containing protein [Pirellula sp. SH-Sr6A]AMV34598.1 Response regulator PleD [Pirellula sp. SH-Sr6A]